ncbi:MAG: rhamnulokinase [Prevotellaceae bacterium]|jgi:rhamnulokinase|nr:rhamnulokinase [Prevotellaceae bacterium]
MKSYLALDLGAGSGRAIVGYFKEGRIYLDEVSRFENRRVKLGNTDYWDFLALFDEIKKGISAAVKKGYDLHGIAADTWGVDFGLIDASGSLISNPVSYRDARTAGMSDEAFKSISKEEMYRVSGIQMMEINTLFQLLSLIKRKDSALAVADKLLFIPDLINFFLTGRIANEYTIASTSQLLNVRTKQWDISLFERLALPSKLVAEIVHPGTLIGTLSDAIAKETGAKNVKVYAAGSHDTASAIAAIPFEGDNCAFLSSGTWSLFGITADEAILTEKAFADDFTNEGGANGKILFMRNITGLWLLQRLIDEWESAEGEKQSYEFLLSEAAKAEPFRSLVNSDEAVFANPQSMSAAIDEYCRATAQPSPRNKGEYLRCVMESLALKYRVVNDCLRECSGKSVEKLYIVGGGSRNLMLNQMIANALNLEVITGLVEATAAGNIMQQAIADGTVENEIVGHEIIRKSFNFASYKPKEHQEWLQAIRRFTDILQIKK